MTIPFSSSAKSRRVEVRIDADTVAAVAFHQTRILPVHLEALLVDDRKRNRRAVSARGGDFHRRDAGKIGRVQRLKLGVGQLVRRGIIGIPLRRLRPAGEVASARRHSARWCTVRRSPRQRAAAAASPRSCHTESAGLADATLKAFDIDPILRRADALQHEIRLRQEDVRLGDVGMIEIHVEDLEAGRVLVRH